MFESLSDKLKRTLKNLRGEGVLTKEHVEAALREIRLALLEADVNYKVAKDFIASVKEKAEVPVGRTQTFRTGRKARLANVLTYWVGQRRGLIYRAEPNVV